jgi:hypothetical protein
MMEDGTKLLIGQPNHQGHYDREKKDNSTWWLENL